MDLVPLRPPRECLAGLRGLSPYLVRTALLHATTAIVTLAALGAAVAQDRASERGQTPNSNAKPPVEIKPHEKHGDVLTLRGQVLLPDGRPAAGARVSLCTYWTAGVKWRPLVTTMADARGNFEIRIPNSAADDGIASVGVGWMAAVAPGYGVQWTTIALKKLDSSKPVVLKLIRDLPIHGRVVDLSGRPIEGVRVGLLYIRAPKEGQDLNPWLEALRSGQPARASNARLGNRLLVYDDESAAPVKTDREGRFVIAGIGAERNARLELRGETIAYQQIDVATRDMKPLVLELAPPGNGIHAGDTDQVFGANFTFQAAPTQPLIGTVRDAATGRPLVGVRVESSRLARTFINAHNVLSTETDAQGHYRLVGLPRATPRGGGSKNEITVIPRDYQPYFVQRIEVPSSPATGPLTLDIDMHRGIWILGRVTDKVTGKPVRSNVKYFPFLTNKLAANLPEFNRNGGSLRDELRCHTGPDGSFRLVGQTGPGIVAASVPGGPYRKGVGAAEIAGVAIGGRFPTFPKMRPANSNLENALVEINPAPGLEAVACDLVLDPGGTIRLTVTDSSGKPVDGCFTFGRSAANTQEAGNGSTFNVEGLAPNERRWLYIYSHQRQLGRCLLLTYDKRAPRAMTTSLEPCATIVGRLVDQQGVPLKGVDVRPFPGRGGAFLQGALSGPDGKFECLGLVTGCDYALIVRGGGVEYQTVLKKIDVEPGKWIALGDIKLKRRGEE